MTVHSTVSMWWTMVTIYEGPMTVVLWVSMWWTMVTRFE